MFGAITYLPVFFQIVHGESPTISGLQLLPLLVGLIICSTGSGSVISRTGRYRVFPIAGTALMTVGLLLLSQDGDRDELDRHGAVHVRARHGARLRDAGARAHRAERRSLLRARRRHLGRDVLPLDRRIASAPRSSAPSSRTSSSATSSDTSAPRDCRPGSRARASRRRSSTSSRRPSITASPPPTRSRSRRCSSSPRRSASSRSSPPGSSPRWSSGEESARPPNPHRKPHQRPNSRNVNRPTPTSTPQRTRSQTARYSVPARRPAQRDVLNDRKHEDQRERAVTAAFAQIQACVAWLSTTAFALRPAPAELSQWRHLNHADHRAPALAARLHSRRPALGDAAERTCAMPRIERLRLTAPC